MKQLSLLGVAAAAMIGASSVASAANLVVNGGFETGDFTGWTQSGDTSSTFVESFFVHSGNFAATFGPIFSLGFLSQTLTTTAGTGYTISFWLASNGIEASKGIEANNEFDVEWNGTTLNDQTDLPLFNYTQYTFNVTGTGSDTLTFSFYNPPGLFFLDDVSVDVAGAVPEPASLALLGTSLIGFGIMRRRRRAA